MPDVATQTSQHKLGHSRRCPWKLSKILRKCTYQRRQNIKSDKTVEVLDLTNNSRSHKHKKKASSSSESNSTIYVEPTRMDQPLRKPVSFYRSWVDDQIVVVNIIPGHPTNTELQEMITDAWDQDTGDFEFTLCRRLLSKKRIREIVTRQDEIKNIFHDGMLMDKEVKWSVKDDEPSTSIYRSEIDDSFRTAKEEPSSSYDEKPDLSGHMTIGKRITNFFTSSSRSYNIS